MGVGCHGQLMYWFTTHSPYVEDGELGVDPRESIMIADLGDVFTIPGNIEKTFDQISKAVGHVYSSGGFPAALGEGLP